MVAERSNALLRYFFILLASGCFYSDTINERPSLDIHQPDPGPVFRASSLGLDAVSNDPDGDPVTVQWRVYACTAGSCDTEPFQTAVTPTILVDVPAQRTEATADCLGDHSCSFDTLHVTLEGRDSYGAVARPIQTLDLAVNDNAPTLELRKAPRHAYVVNTPVNIYATIADVDDDATLEPPAWTAFSTIDNNHTGMLVDLPVPPAPPMYTKVFTPDSTGLWTIRVATSDATQTTTTDLPIQIDADHAPCLTQWSPTATALPGTTLPLTELTRFQVGVVTDDLDPYPGVPNDPVLGTTEFHWSIVPPGGTRQPLANVTGNGVPLDPGNYHTGDVVELRVEIQYRNHTPVNCPESDLTCSVISNNACLQRLTWRAEVR